VTNRGFLFLADHSSPSREELVLLFVACMIPVHVWSIFNVLREVPAWILIILMRNIIS